MEYTTEITSAVAPFGTEVKKSCRSFIEYFVKTFEKRLHDDSLVLGRLKEKPGKFSDTFGTITGQVLGCSIGALAGLFVPFPGTTIFGAETGAKIGKNASSKIGGYWGKRFHKKKVISRLELVYHYEDNKVALRRELVKLAFDLFQSFEMQFMHMATKEAGQREAVRLLAMDAANRIINFCGQNNAMDASAVLSGKSKVEKIVGLPMTDKIKTPGFELLFKVGSNQKEIECNSARLYEKVGLLVEANGQNEYFRIPKSKNWKNAFFVQKSKKEKYGFRRLFKAEKENWKEVIDDGYEPVNGDEIDEHFRIYRYLVNHEDMEEMCHEIYEEINIQDPNLSEMRAKQNEHHEENMAALGKTQTNLKKFKEEIIDHLKQRKEEEERPILFENADYFKSVATYTGREQELKKLHKLLLTRIKQVVISQVALVTGLAGIGKTELTRKYAFEHREFYKNMVWINAEMAQNISITFKRLAEVLKISIVEETKEGKQTERDIKQIVTDIYKNLNKRGPTLIIFDNTEQYKDLKDFLFSVSIEENNLYSLITSRNRKWKTGEEGEVKDMELNGFKPDEARKYVRDFLNLREEQEEDINKLIETLYCYPLALRQSVAFIKEENERNEAIGEGSFKIRHFLDKLSDQDKAKDLLEHAFSDSDSDRYTKTVRNTWETTMERIREIEEEGQKADGKLKAEDFLNIISYFAPDNINVREIFSEGHCDSPVNWDSIRLLHKYSMINLHRGIVSLHRMVQDVIRMRNETAERAERAVERALRIINKAPKNQETMTHATFLWKYASEYQRICVRQISSTYGPYKSGPLHLLAASNDHKAITKILKRRPRIDIDSKDLLNRTALFVAASNGHFDSVTVLVEKKANIDAECCNSYKGTSNWTILHEAVCKGHVDIVDYLVSKGANFNRTDVWGRVPLYYALIYNFGNIAKILDVNDQNSPNILAVIGDVKSFEGILKNKSEVDRMRLINSPEKGKYGPLHFAVRNCHLDMVKFLINQGADVHHPGEYGKTPFHVTSTCSLEIAEYFTNYILNKDCEFNVLKYVNDTGWTVLHEAAFFGKTTILKYLIEKFSEGKDESFKKSLVDAVNYNEQTLLFNAVHWGYLETVEYLVNAEANVNNADIFGVTPLLLASIRHQTEVFNYLLATCNDIKIYGDPSKFFGKLGLTPLHVAAFYDDLEMAELLVKNNADVNAGRGVSFTPLHVAQRFRCAKIFKYLDEKGADKEAVINWENIMNTFKLFQNDWKYWKDFIFRSKLYVRYIKLIIVNSGSIHKTSILSFLDTFVEILQLIKKFINDGNSDAAARLTNEFGIPVLNITEHPAE